MIKALLNYQENDKKLFEIEMKLSTSEERKKAVSARKYLESVDENLTKLDLRAGELDFVLKTVIKEKEKLKEELQDVKTVSSGIESREEAEFIVKKIEKIVTAIKKVSDEIDRIEKEILSIATEHSKIAATTKQAKEQYLTYKAKYDDLKKSVEDEIGEIKACLDQIAKGVEVGLLNLYKEKRKSLNKCPVIFKVNGKVCGACNMELPGNTLGKIKAGEVIVCETCGRLLYGE